MTDLQIIPEIEVRVLSADVAVQITETLCEHIKCELEKFVNKNDCRIRVADSSLNSFYEIQWRDDKKWYKTNVIIDRQIMTLGIPLHDVSRTALDKLHFFLYADLLKPLANLIVPSGYVRTINLKFIYDESIVDLYEETRPFQLKIISQKVIDKFDINLNLIKFLDASMEPTYYRYPEPSKAILYRYHYHLHQRSNHAEIAHSIIMPQVTKALEKLNAFRPMSDQSIATDCWRDNSHVMGDVIIQKLFGSEMNIRTYPAL